MALRPVPVPFDPGWGKDRARLRELAEATDAAREPALGLLLLGRALGQAGMEGQAGRLYRAALWARPRDATLHQSLGSLLEEQGRWQEATESYAVVRALPPGTGAALASALVHAGRVEEGLALYERLLLERPDDPWLHNHHGATLADDLNRYRQAEKAFRRAVLLKEDHPRAYVGLGAVLARLGRLQEAEGPMRRAIRLRADNSVAHRNLGVLLEKLGRHREAEESYRRAILLKEDDSTAHTFLGNALESQGRFKEAEESYRRAILLKGDNRDAHANLGVALIKQGRHKEAEKAIRQALRFKHDSPDAHLNLGEVLRSQGRLKEAEWCYREAVSFEYNDPRGHFELGVVLAEQSRHKEAEEAFRKAIFFKEDFHLAYDNLGKVLADQGRLQEAEEAFRQAVRLRPDDPLAHTNLGAVLGIQGRHREAEEACRRAILLKKDFHMAHCNLGHILRDQGRFGEAVEAFRTGHRLGSATSDWAYPSAAWLRHCEKLLELDRLLQPVLKGAAQPAGANERLELAYLCRLPCRGLYATAERLAAEAFSERPELADDLKEGYRYEAACSASLAGCGKGADAASVPGKARASLRKRALEWLRADLAPWAEHKDLAALERTLRHWQKDPNLASVRDPAELQKLPEAERLEWQRLWAEVGSLLKKAGARP
jgi:Flp pilus assembly protein TadD